MKVGVVILWSEPFGGGSPKTGGLISAGANLVNDLRAAGFDAAAYYLVPDKSRKALKPSHHQEYQFKKISEYLADKPDVTLFTSGGNFNDHKFPLEESPIYFVLQRLEEFKPFGFWIHDEVEKRTCPHIPLFERGASLVLAITPEIAQRVLSLDADVLIHTGLPKHLAPQQVPDSRPLAIGTTSRMTSRKSIIPFLKLAAPEFIANGFAVKVHGASSSFFYTRAVQEEARRVGAHYGGDYQNVCEVMATLTHHANLPYLKNGTFIPRIEIATAEAAAEGLIPVLLKETAPSFITPNEAILVGRDELNQMYSRVRDSRATNAAFVSRYNELNGQSIEQLKRRIEAIV